MTKAKSDQDDSMRVLKTATCKTLSGKSTLTYQIGCDTEDVVHFRISKNSGGGFFSDEWVALKAIQAALEKRRKDQTVTSYLLAQVFDGKSANNCAFLLSVLVNEKLLLPLKGKKREHEPLDPGPFLDKMEKLMASDVKPKGTTRKMTRKTSAKKTGGNAAVKKRSVTKKKTASRRSGRA